MSVRRKFTAEFKREVVRQIAAGDKPASQLAEELGIGRTLLLGWVKQLEDDPANAFRGHGQRTADQAELAALRHQLQRVTQERDLLKKAIARCSQEQP